MTPFGILVRLSGLSQAEAAEFLRVASSQVEKMVRGTRSTPAGIIAEMRELIGRQAEAADAMLDAIDEALPPEVELGYPADSYEAQQLGMPTVSAWGAVAARVVAEANVPVRLVPRGSTVATAAAQDAHDAAP